MRPADGRVERAIALYVYGLLPSWGEPLVRWVVQPGAVGSGLDVVRRAAAEVREEGREGVASAGSRERYE